MIKKFRLQRDIIIPKGTVFEDISNCTFWCGKNNISGSVGVETGIGGRLVLNVDKESDEFPKLFKRAKEVGGDMYFHQERRKGDM